MKKLSMELDRLSVQSFHVQDEAGGQGTVQGNENEEAAAAAITGWSWLCGSCNATCDGGATCPLSCAGEAPTGCNSRYCQEQVLSEIQKCHAETAVGVETGVDAQHGAIGS